MNHSRLFNVLVLGGLATLNSTQVFGAGNLDQPLTSGFEVGHGSTQMQELLEQDAQFQEAKPTLCDPNAEVCVVGPSGKKEPKAGFTCCWGTSCE